jgi:hypothetical protein
MRRPLIRLNYGAAIDLPMALIAESTLGVGSQVRDQSGRTWKRMARGDWMTAAQRGLNQNALPSLVDVVQEHGPVVVIRILGSELA